MRTKDVIMNYKVGDRLTEDGKRVVRVMAIVEGYLVLRYPQAMPFCLSPTEAHRRFVHAPPESVQQRGVDE